MRLEWSPLSTISSAFLSNHFTFDHIKMKENVPLCSFMCYMYVCMALSLSLVTTLFLNYPQKNSSTNLNITPAILIPLWFSIHHFQLAIYYHLFFLSSTWYRWALLPSINLSTHPYFFPSIHVETIFSWLLWHNIFLSLFLLHITNILWLHGRLSPKDLNIVCLRDRSYLKNQKNWGKKNQLLLP